MYFFPSLFVQINNKAPLLCWWGKKVISMEMDDGPLCLRENSCNRNGNVLPLSDHVQFEMHSLGGNLSYRTFLFPCLSLLLLLITQWDAEKDFRAWQKSNSMNLMSLSDLLDPECARTHARAHTHTNIHTARQAYLCPNPFHDAVGLKWILVCNGQKSGKYPEHIIGLLEGLQIWTDTFLGLCLLDFLFVCTSMEAPS